MSLASLLQHAIDSNAKEGERGGNIALDMGEKPLLLRGLILISQIFCWESLCAHWMPLLHRNSHRLQASALGTLSNRHGRPLQGQPISVDLALLISLSYKRAPLNILQLTNMHLWTLGRVGGCLHDGSISSSNLQMFFEGDGTGLRKKKSVEGKTGYPRAVFKSYIRCFGQNICPAVPILNAQYRNLHKESLVWGIISLKAWKWQLSLAHTLQMCAEVMITPCGTAFRSNDL